MSLHISINVGASRMYKIQAADNRKQAIDRVKVLLANTKGIIMSGAGFSVPTERGPYGAPRMCVDSAASESIVPVR
jgi:hypothetical protein